MHNLSKCTSYIFYTINNISSFAVVSYFAFFSFFQSVMGQYYLSCCLVLFIFVVLLGLLFISYFMRFLVILLFLVLFSSDIYGLLLFLLCLIFI